MTTSSDNHSTTSWPTGESGLPIAAVERETGLGKDTLRVWERRYGFPQPVRDSAGDRLYGEDQVQQLKLIRRLLDRGQRPRNVVGLSFDELQALVTESAGSTETPLSRTNTSMARPELEEYLTAIGNHTPGVLRQRLHQAHARMGLETFVLEVVAPLTTAVGGAWEVGRFQVYEEHLYTEVLTGVMHHAIASLAPRLQPRPPKILLTTFPNELHSLGLLMVEALLTLEGCSCISLGTQTPLTDLVQAAQAHQVDVVGISCTNVLSGQMVLSNLRELRSRLPATTELWAGGSSSALYQRPIEGVSVARELSTLQALLAQWRQTHPEHEEAQAEAAL